MNISRFLREDLIRLEMQSEFDPPEDGKYSGRQLLEIKETILAEMVELLDSTGKVVNKHKLLTDLTNREKKASTGIGKGIAIPHVRSMQAREFIICVGRKLAGYEFDSLDHEPVKLILCMAAPPYDDNLYLRVFKDLAEKFDYDGFVERLLSATVPYDIIRTFKEFE